MLSSTRPGNFDSGKPIILQGQNLVPWCTGIASKATRCLSRQPGHEVRLVRPESRSRPIEAVEQSHRRETANTLRTIACVSRPCRGAWLLPLVACGLRAGRLELRYSVEGGERRWPCNMSIIADVVPAQLGCRAETGRKMPKAHA